MGERYYVEGVYIVIVLYDGDKSCYVIIVEVYGVDVGVGFFMGKKDVDVFVFVFGCSD